MGENHFRTMSNVITKKIAEQFLADEESTELDEYNFIDESAAESLSQHQGEEGLYLSELTELSDAAAKSLSKHQGELYLSGLSKLSDAAAKSLTKHQGSIDGMEPKEWLSVQFDYTD